MQSQVRFPSDCMVVGQVQISNDEFFRVDEFFIKGYHPELHAWGQVEIIDGKTGLETKVRVFQAPSEYFLG
jgi:hypothetical protein